MLHRDYAYTDVAQGGKSRRSLIPVAGLRDWLASLGTAPIDVHKSLYRYNGSVIEYVKKTGSLRHYHDRVWSDFLPLELDPNEGQAFEDILSGGRAIANHLKATWGLSWEHLAGFYSGSRSLHLMLPVKHFLGKDSPVIPHEDFNVWLYEVMLGLLEGAQLEDGRPLLQKKNTFLISPVLDLGLFSPGHMIRMPNTVHEKTRRFKIQLLDPTLLEEPEEILHMASESRPIMAARPSALEDLHHLGRSAWEALQEGRARLPSRVTNRLPGDARALSADGLDEEARLGRLVGFSGHSSRQRFLSDILRGGMRETEQRGGVAGRHMALLKAAATLRHVYRMPQDVVETIMLLWNQSNEEPLPEEEVLHTVADVFAAGEEALFQTASFRASS